MKVAVVLTMLLLISTNLLAQFPPSAQNQLAGGLGVTWIDNQPFYAVHVRPEFSISNVGIGLDLLLEVDAHGNLRKEDFQQFSDYVRVIRYVSYGKENDPLFLKLGALDYVTLGHGSIVNTYNNSPSFDARKTGLQLNLNFDKGGIQTIYGNFAQAGVAGIRAFVNPLQFTSMADAPILGNLEVGATYATDFDKYANIDTVRSLMPLDVGTNGSLNIIGADIGLPLVKNDFVRLELYSDFVKIVNLGSGATVGILFNGDATELLKVRAKMERRFNGDQYLPGYFGPFYEIERFNALSGFSSKSYALKYLTNNNNGVYGELLIRLINTFDIIGSYQKFDRDSSGALHLAADVAPKDAPFIARAGYDKINIIDFHDLVTTDDRSFLYAEVGYKPIDYLIVSTMYMWTFSPMYDADNNVVGYGPQRKIEPRVTFVYPLK